VAASPETRYARRGTVEIAFQVVGEADLCLFYLPPAHVPIDLAWEEPHCRRFLERLASFSRLVLFDPRGWAASAATVAPGVPSAEDWADDISLVMDAAGIERAALVGQAEGAFCSVYFAAAHPERVSALVMANAYARYLRADDYPAGLPPEFVDGAADAIAEHFGTGWSADVLTPSLAGDPEFRRWWARCERLSTSPAALKSYWREIVSRDIRSVLPSVRVPTLVIHRRDDNYAPVAHGRYLADHIHGASYVELEGADNFLFAGDADLLIDEIESFLTGAQPSHHLDRVLATVLFTDIVDSTRRAAEMGDHAWRGLLDSHDEAATRLVDSHRGRLVKSTGDGLLATFDGPSRAIDCAVALVAAARRAGIELRAGLHTGEIELRDEDVGGLSVHVAARVQSLADPGQVLVSRTVTELVAGSGLEFEDRGDHELKGVPGRWELFSVNA
jgi:class 3 adenylate cyclase